MVRIDGDVAEAGKVLDAPGGAVAVGIWTHTHPNGKLARRGLYIGGKRSGVWESWYDDGTRESEQTWAEGRLSGPSLEYWPNGKVSARGTYMRGAKSGKWETYAATGKPIEVCHYDNDQRSGDCWFAAPEDARMPWKFSSGAMRNDQRDGLWTFWYDSLRKEGEATYAHGVSHGVSRVWSAAGALTEERHHRYGLLHGPQLALSKEGALQRSYYYLDRPLAGEAAWDSLSRGDVGRGASELSPLTYATLVAPYPGRLQSIARPGAVVRAANDEATATVVAEPVRRALGMAMAELQRSVLTEDIASPDYYVDPTLLRIDTASFQLAVQTRRFKLVPTPAGPSAPADYEAAVRWRKAATTGPTAADREVLRGLRYLHTGLLSIGDDSLARGLAAEYTALSALSDSITYSPSRRLALWHYREVLLSPLDLLEYPIEAARRTRDLWRYLARSGGALDAERVLPERGALCDAALQGRLHESQMDALAGDWNALADSAMVWRRRFDDLVVNPDSLAAVMKDVYERRRKVLENAQGSATTKDSLEVLNKIEADVEAAEGRRYALQFRLNGKILCVTPGIRREGGHIRLPFPTPKILGGARHRFLTFQASEAELRGSDVLQGSALDRLRLDLRAARTGFALRREIYADPWRAGQWPGVFIFELAVVRRELDAMEADARGAAQYLAALDEFEAWFDARVLAASEYAARVRVLQQLQTLREAGRLVLPQTVQVVSHQRAEGDSVNAGEPIMDVVAVERRILHLRFNRGDPVLMALSPGDSIDLVLRRAGRPPLAAEVLGWVEGMSATDQDAFLEAVTTSFGRPIRFSGTLVAKSDVGEGVMADVRVTATVDDSFIPLPQSALAYVAAGRPRDVFRRVDGADAGGSPFAVPAAAAVGRWYIRLDDRSLQATSRGNIEVLGTSKAGMEELRRVIAWQVTARPQS
ncbi:MAG: hypothetical protein IPK85_06840 [Gemmatimonadetes bacterium]|nr:hypothetical protein [Gemmatimonadota bacterium]